jgi:hypothetical protein
MGISWVKSLFCCNKCGGRKKVPNRHRTAHRARAVLSRACTVCIGAGGRVFLTKLSAGDPRLFVTFRVIYSRATGICIVMQ